MVQPAPQPFGVVATASTSGWSGSGVNPAASSSPSGAFTGPHYVEEQSLQIQYKRVPVADDFMMDKTLNLSAASATYLHAHTVLACIVTANYSRKRVDAIFSTSSYQQPQKFEFLSVSTDAQGNSYGDVNASCLGPAGTIITSQPWYYRRPWDATADTEVVSSVTLANFGVGASGDTGERYSYDQRLYDNVGYFWIPPWKPFTFGADHTPFAIATPVPDYYLPGTYNTGQESLAAIISFIEDMAFDLSNEDLCAIPATMGTPFGYNFLRRDSGLPEYAGFRHDYS